ncbi:DUF4334 domain-containing protein [Streptomyces sp. BHT-5-2]|uniref:DUF4334 domain-containing protein n=1 Tax=unclassified Streptomyces TaxID=2593676 RepID=UPI001C8DCA48|nr:DUF4334 domain-containing protein [Streptomyces sp. BHT-5-2]QZL05047.1 DUF4334 domain-containing protein [Streptomyces sp. BHT-5-2]
MDVEQARERIAEIRAAGGKVSIDELDALWGALPPVRTEEILGAWRGGAFVTGHRVESLLAAANWHGKRFHSPTDVQPLICRDADGTLFSDIEAGKGEAGLWMVEFRGESTASMVYDGQPVIDHFKRIDDTTLLGVMNGKDVLDDGRHFYFFLERE